MFGVELRFAQKVVDGWATTQELSGQHVSNETFMGDLLRRGK
jgi:hypothetical protein